MERYPLLMDEEVKQEVSAPRRTRVSRKNQVTLPVAAMAAAAVDAGDVLRVEVEAEGVFRLVREQDPLDVLIGSAPGIAAAVDMDELRNEWER
jgi:bifunctional DNA-binding transcriptional regulator/antitoxin component of YhaV-PrlF toxin-antitoxin module